MRDAKLIRKELRAAGKQRVSAQRKGAAIDQRLSELLREAQGHDDITMAEAAKLADIGRPMAYKLIRRT